MAVQEGGFGWPLVAGGSQEERERGPAAKGEKERKRKETYRTFEGARE